MYLIFQDANGKREFTINGGPEDGTTRSYLMDDKTNRSYAFNPRVVSLEQAAEDFTKELQNVTR